MQVLKILGIALASFFTLLVTIGLVMPAEYLYDEEYAYYEDEFGPDYAGYEDYEMAAPAEPGFANSNSNSNSNARAYGNARPVGNTPSYAPAQARSGAQNGTIMHPVKDPKTG